MEVNKMLTMCRFSVQRELESTVTKNLHSSKAMWSTAVNHCKHHALDAVTPFLHGLTIDNRATFWPFPIPFQCFIIYGLTDASSPYMVHEWVGLVFIYRTSIRSPSLVPDRLKFTERRGGQR